VASLLLLLLLLRRQHFDDARRGSDSPPHCRQMERSSSHRHERARGRRNPEINPSQNMHAANEYYEPEISLAFHS
jgi:hypothetical protein